MKKLIALVLSLMMVLCVACAAVAETRVYVMSSVLDTEGEPVDAGELPESYIAISDDDLSVAMSYEGEVVEGLMENIAVDEEAGCITFTFTVEGETTTIAYYEETDACAVIDEANAMVYVYARAAE